MIPKNYTSFVAPCMALRYYQDIATYADVSKHKFSNFESSYVVHMTNKYTIAPPQKLFTFSHPNFGMFRIIETYAIFFILPFQFQSFSLHF